MLLTANTLFPSLVLISAVITSLIAALVYRNKNLQVNWSLSLLLLVCSIYSFSYGLELFSNDILFKIFFLKLQYFGAPFISPLMLIFVINFAGRSYLLNKWVISILFLVPLLIMLSVLFNGWHHHFYTSFEIVTHHGVQIMETGKGPLYVLHNAYSMLLASISLYVFIRLFFSSNKVYFIQILFVFIGFIVPYFSYFLYFFNVVPLGLDPIPVSFAATGILIYIGLRQYNLFKIAPIAYQSLFENLSDGIIWLDDKKSTILALNDSAKKMFDFEQPSNHKNLTESLISAFPEFSNVLEKLQTNTSFEFAKGSGSERRWFSVAPSTIVKNNREVLGYFVLIKDITDLKESDSQFREAQILLNTFFDQVPMLMGVVMLQEKDIILLKSNQLTVKYFTGAVGEVSNLSFKSVGFSKHEIQQWIYEFRLAEQKQKNSYFEITLAPKQSSKKYTLGTTLIYLGIMPGKQKRYAFIAQDITDKKKAEESILKSNNFLSQTSKVAQVGGWEIDFAKNVSELTQTTRDIFELNDKIRPLPKNLLKYFTRKSRFKILPKIRDLITHGDPFDLELSIHNSKKGIIWVRLIANADFEADKCVRIYGVVQNIDLLKRNTLELKAAEQKLESIFREMSDVVWSLSLPDFEILFITPSVFSLYEIDISDWYSSIYIREKVVFKEDIQIVQNIWKELESNGTHNTQFRINSSKNGIKWIQFKAKVIYNTDGVPIRIDGYEYDITVQKKAQEQLEFAINEAIGANNAKSEFLANMSHEIRTPLNGIIGFNDLLLNTELSEVQKGFVLNTQSSAESLLIIINDILDFSKVESGKLEFELVETNLLSLIEHSVDMFVHQAEQKQLEIIVSVEPNLPEIVVIDPIRVKQILVNLIGNAVKFTHTGEVEVGIKFEEITHEIGTLVFEVRDTGIGISKSEQEKLFKAFSQADTSITRKFGGTGLGLAISNSLINQMNSSIKLESELGVGSTFSFSIEAEFKYGELLKIDSEFRPQKVLIVDDNPTFGRSIERMLNYCAIESFYCDSDEDGLKFLENMDFECILLDIELLKKNPKIWAKVLLEISKERKLQFIVMCNHAQITDLETLKIQFPQIVELYKPVRFIDIKQAFESAHLLNVSQVEAPKTNKDEKFPKLKTVKTIHVLIAEDVDINRMLMEYIMNDSIENIVIHQAINGVQAVDIYKNEAIDIVLMDIQMPEMDGLTATRIIRELEGNNNINTPIFALTAGALQEEKQKAFSAGVNEFITKPIKYELLYQNLEYYLSKMGVLINGSTSSELCVFNVVAFKKRMLGFEEIKIPTLINAQQDIPNYINALIEAINVDNRVEIKRVAHSIKGLSQTLGFEILGDITKQIESSASSNQELKKWPDILLKNWDLVKIELKNFLD